MMGLIMAIKEKASLVNPQQQTSCQSRSKWFVVRSRTTSSPYIRSKQDDSSTRWETRSVLCPTGGGCAAIEYGGV